MTSVLWKLQMYELYFPRGIFCFKNTPRWQEHGHLCSKVNVSSSQLQTTPCLGVAKPASLPDRFRVQKTAFTRTLLLIYQPAANICTHQSKNVRFFNELPRCRRAESRMPANVRRAAVGRRSFFFFFINSCNSPVDVGFKSYRCASLTSCGQTWVFVWRPRHYLCLVRVSNAGVEFGFSTRELSPPLLMWHALRRWRGWIAWDEHEQKVRLTRASLASRADI